MEIRLFKDVLIGMPIFLLAAMLYVRLMLLIAHIPNSFKKFILLLLMVTSITIAVLAPFLYVIEQNQPNVNSSWHTLLAVLITCILIEMPGIYYIKKVKLNKKLLEINNARKLM